MPTAETTPPPFTLHHLRTLARSNLTTACLCPVPGVVYHHLDMASAVHIGFLPVPGEEESWKTLVSTSVTLAASAPLNLTAWSTTGHSTTAHRLDSVKKDLHSDNLEPGTSCGIPTQDVQAVTTQSTESTEVSPQAAGAWISRGLFTRSCPRLSIQAANLHKGMRGANKHIRP